MNKFVLIDIQDLNYYQQSN